MSRRPLLLRAPVRLLASPAWSAVVVVAAALFVAALVAPVWFLRAADDAALQASRTAAGNDEFGGTTPNLRVSWQGYVPRAAQPVLDAELRDLPGFGDPVETGRGSGPQPLLRPLVSAGGHSDVATLWTRDGAIEAVAGGEPTRAQRRGVWLPSEGLTLDVEVGDVVRLSITPYSETGLGDRVVRARVAGFFERVPGSGLPEAMVSSGADPLLYPWYPERAVGNGSALVVADPALFRRLSRAVSDAPSYTADMRLDPDVTAPGLKEAVAAVAALGKRLYDPAEELRFLLSQATPIPVSPQLITGAPLLMQSAQATAAQAELQVSPFVRSTQVLALGLVVVALSLLASRRSLEQQAMTDLGVPAWERTLLSVLELVPLAVAALPLGLVLAYADIAAFGPPGRPEVGDTVGVVAARAAVGVVAVLAIAALIGAWSAWRLDRRATGLGMAAHGRSGSWRVGVLVAGAVVWAAVAGTDVVDRATGPVTVLFPMTTAAAVAVAVTWWWPAVATRLPLRGRRPGSAGWLARTRIPTGVLPVSLALAVGLSVLGYGFAARRGVAEAVDDKAAGLAGAAVTVDVDQQLQGVPWRRVVEDLGPGTSVIYQSSGALPPVFGDRPVVVVDPETFADAADWGATLDRTARVALDRLAAADAEESVPAILVGTPELGVGDRGQVVLAPAPAVPYRVIAVVDAFPGASALRSDVTMIVPRAGFLPWLSPLVSPRTDPSRVRAPFRAAVWSSADRATTLRAVGSAGLDAGQVTVVAQARSQPRLLAADWAVGYLGPLQLGSVLLVIGAVLLLGRRLLDRDAVTDVVLARMGWTSRELLASRSREVLGVASLSLGAAALTTALLFLAPTTLESVPELPPLATPSLAWTDVAWWLGCALVALALGTAFLAWGARRRVPQEVLRDIR